MNPRYPIFIPTKGRHEYPLTIKAFERLGVSFRAVVQPQEYDRYAAVVADPSSLLTLPAGVDGLVPTRNWIWDHAQALGVPFFWTFDDNIQNFYRLHRNVKAMVTDGTFLRVMEDFMDRYENVAILGMQYEFFVPRRQKSPAFILNTRVYSNMLIRAGIPFRNRGIYNDDTDLCLRVLKAGWCTVEFIAFLAKKVTTMTVPGGNTPIYQGDGRLLMAQSLQRQHPDVVTIVRKWGRWQHQVNYRPFRGNRLRLKPGLVIPEGTDEYGMVLRERGQAATVKGSDSDRPSGEVLHSR